MRVSGSGVDDRRDGLMAMKMDRNLKHTRVRQGVISRTEIWDKGSNQESVEVTLAVTNNIGDMETEVSTSCIQRGTPVE